MKKLIIFLLLIPLFGLSQGGSNIHYSNFVVADTITTDTGYVVNMTADYTWLLYTTWGATATSTTTITLQESGDNGSTWADVAGYAAITTNSTTGSTGFQGDYSHALKYRLYYNVTASETIIVNAWYTLKVKPR